jgi:hypothetical protein
LVEKTEKKELKTFSVKELPKGTVVDFLAVVKTVREFTDKTEGSDTYGQKKTINVFVFKVKIGGEVGVLPINEGTTMFNQMEKYFDQEDIEVSETPIKFNLSLTVEKGGNKLRQYSFFSELNEDYSSLFDEF